MPQRSLLNIVESTVIGVVAEICYIFIGVRCTIWHIMSIRSVSTVTCVVCLRLLFLSGMLTGYYANP